MSILGRHIIVFTWQNFEKILKQTSILAKKAQT